MRHAMLILVGVAVLFAVVAQTQTAIGNPADEAAIQDIRKARVAAWNQHDAKAIAALYATDADRVRSNGNYSSGRAEIEKSYVDTFSGVNKTATMKDESVKVRFLTADVALLDTDFVITGRTDGTTLKQHGTLVYVKRNGGWQVVANRAITKP